MGNIQSSPHSPHNRKVLLCGYLACPYKALLHYVFELRSTCLIVTHNHLVAGSNPAGPTILSYPITKPAFIRKKQRTRCQTSLFVTVPSDSSLSAEKQNVFLKK